MIFVLGKPTIYNEEELMDKDYSSIEEAVSVINFYHTKINKQNNISILYGKRCGKILSIMKLELEKRKLHFSSFTAKLKFSLSWCYFLINLFNLIHQYKGLNQVCMSLHDLQKDFKIIKKYIVKEEFGKDWKSLLY